MKQVFETTGYVACPHTATALEAHARLPADQKAERPWVLGATAHPAKFADIVEPVIGRTVDLPPALADVLERPVRVRDIPGASDALARALETGMCRPEPRADPDFQSKAAAPQRLPFLVGSRTAKTTKLSAGRPAESIAAHGDILKTRFGRIFSANDKPLKNRTFISHDYAIGRPVYDCVKRRFTIMFYSTT